MGIEGGLEFQLYCDAGKVMDVNIHSTRPLQAVKIFEGKSPAEMLQTLPLLFHVCGVAQASAAMKACEQAQGITTNTATVQARDMLVWMETAREHLLRIMMDWSDRLAEAKDKASLVKLQQCVANVKQALFMKGNAFSPDAVLSVDEKEVLKQITIIKAMLQQHVFAMPADEWLNLTNFDELQQWMTTQQTLASRMLQQVSEVDHGVASELKTHYLPRLHDNVLHQRLCEDNADRFSAQPVWDGGPCETTALSRQSQHSLVAQMLATRGADMLTRMVARLVELAGIPARLASLYHDIMTQQSIKSTNHAEQHSGAGIGQVEAARGRLIHRVELAQGIIQRYQIVAPTEWNFHPQGVAAQLLKTLPANDEKILRQQADLLINTIDPCVRYDMVIH